MDDHLAVVVASRDFQDDEYSAVKERLTASGMIVKNVSTITEEAIGICGKRVEIDLAVKSIDQDDFQGLILIGGSGVRSLLNDGDLIDLIRRFNEKGKVIGAICWAPEILARAGILKNRKVTVWEGAVEALKQSGAIVTKEGVQQDGNLITASGLAYANRFVETIIQSIVKKNKPL